MRRTRRLRALEKSMVEVVCEDSQDGAIEELVESLNKVTSKAAKCEEELKAELDRLPPTVHGMEVAEAQAKLARVVAETEVLDKDLERLLRESIQLDQQVEKMTKQLLGEL